MVLDFLMKVLQHSPFSNSSICCNHEMFLLALCSCFDTPICSCHRTMPRPSASSFVYASIYPFLPCINTPLAKFTPVSLCPLTPDAWQWEVNLKTLSSFYSKIVWGFQCLLTRQTSLHIIC